MSDSQLSDDNLQLANFDSGIIFKIKGDRSELDSSICFNPFRDTPDSIISKFSAQQNKIIEIEVDLDFLFIFI